MRTRGGGGGDHNPGPGLFGGEGPPSASAGAPAEGARGERWRPLAERMRPRALAEIAGHPHLLGEGALLPKLVRANRFGSLIFWGPPGCGKTTLAEAIIRETGAPVVRLNAVLSNTAELRDCLRLCAQRAGSLLFIDEIHRFNKAQQDLLLPSLERGDARLLGATTHNPGFYLIPPLLSRSHLFRLEPMGQDDLVALLARALADVERGLGFQQLTAGPEVLHQLALLAAGDPRRALNALETLAATLPMGAELTPELLASFAAERRLRYDAGSDEHYDTASAFIKAMRGGDPDAALYWMTKMLDGGEDPRFLARRLVIFASEDVGLADPRALPLATACFQACEQVGLPECGLNLAHATLFLATCPKSNSATKALGAARAALRGAPVQAVPPWLRDGTGKASAQAGHGRGYLYSHDFPEAISGQAYWEQPLTLYEPGAAGAEPAIAERLARWRALRAQRNREELGQD